MGEKRAVLGKHDLRGWIEGAALSGDLLLGIAEKHHLYVSKRRLGDDAVRESFRDDLLIGISDNYFLVNRTDGSGLRSARVRMQFSADNPQTAEAVVRELAVAVVEYEGATRRKEAEQGIAAVNEVADRATEEVLASERELTLRLAEIESSSSRKPIDVVRAHHMAARIAVTRRALGEISKLRNQSTLRLRNDASVVAQRVSLVHVDRPRERHGWFDVWALGTASLLLLVPLASMTTGAFVSRIVTVEDCLEGMGPDQRIFAIPGAGRNA